MTASDTTPLKFRANVLVQTDLKPAIVLDLVTGHYFEANDSAHELVLGVQFGESESDLIDRLQRVYAIDRDTAEADTRRVLADWRQRGWID